MEIYCFTKNPGQTRKLGQILAQEILRSKRGKRAQVLGLEGELGGGKTTFLQGFAKGLGINEKITSPTFVIAKRFRITKPSFKNFYHIDCYRIKRPKEVSSLGFKEIILNPRNIVAIEWPERIRKILPKEILIIKFVFLNKTSRRIVLEYK